jgi:6-phosphogluconolactonase
VQGELRVVDDVAGAFVAAVVDAAPRTIALSGGDTARRCYERLRPAGVVAWPGVQVVMGDERFVPVDHDDSNEGMARAALLDHVPVAAVHSAWGAGATPTEAAESYDRLVRSLQPLDVVHLGLGDDAHTASLFPGTDALAVADRHVVANAAPEHPHPRLTLTFPAIAAARLVVVTVAGEAKRDALARVRAGDPTAPGSHVRGGRVLWLADAAAAG